MRGVGTRGAQDAPNRATPSARPSSATVSLAVDAEGLIRACEWHTCNADEQPPLTGRRLTDLVAGPDRIEVTKLMLGATSTGARTRGLVCGELGDGPQPLLMTAQDRVADLGVVIVRLLRLAEAADELDALAQLAFWDPLTQLANRALFSEHLRNELERGRRSGKNPAVLAADVDGLKQVNDALGHRAGDALLVEVGRRLRAACRPFDVPARLSGDEFAVLCPEVDNERDLDQLVSRVSGAVNGPAEIYGNRVLLTTSIGWALAAETDYVDAGADLLHRADLCMYGVKRFGASA